MAIDWSLARPRAAIDAFNTTSDRLDRQYQQQRTNQREDRTQRAGDATRQAIGNYYATRDAAPAGTPAPAAPPANGAPLVQVHVASAPPAALPTGADSAGGDAGVADQVRIAPQQPAYQPTPAPTGAPASAPPAVQNPSGPTPVGGTAAVALPTAAPAVATPAPTNGGMPMGTPGATPAPGSPPAAAPAAGGPARPQRNNMNPLMSELAKTPGTEGTMLSMFTADQSSRRASDVENRKINAEAEKEVYNHIKNGDWRIAQSISQRYGLGIPDDVFQHRGAQQALTVGARMADLIKGASAEQKMAYMLDYATVYTKTGDEAQANIAGLNAARKVPKAFETAGHITAPGGKVSLYGKDGSTRQTGLIERERARGGDGSGGNSVFDKKYNAYLRVHPGDEQGALDYSSGRKTISPQEVTRLAIAAAQKDREKEFPLRDDPKLFKARVREYEGWYKNSGNQGGSDGNDDDDGGDSTPAAPPPRPATPPSAGSSSKPSAATPSSASKPPERVRRYVPGKGFVDAAP